MSPKSLKKLGLALLILPLAFLFLFMFGEVFSGDISGLGHLIQAVPLLILLYLSYKKPLIGGSILAIFGATLGILYLFRAPFEIKTILLVELLLFIPPFVSGLLLILSSKK